MNDPLIDRLDWNKGDGLLPLIVQHTHDGRVLMLGYVNREALALTLKTREVHFWSRSKQRIWRKGESSGHVLTWISIAADCDHDTLLCQALPAGPTCHRGSPSCFDGATPAHPWLNELEALIAARMYSSLLCAVSTSLRAVGQQLLISPSKSKATSQHIWSRSRS